MSALVYGHGGWILARMLYSTKFPKNALTVELSVKKQLSLVRTLSGRSAKGRPRFNWPDALGIVDSRSDWFSALTDAMTRASCLVTRGEPERSQADDEQ